jgi:hypothetical protein
MSIRFMYQQDETVLHLLRGTFVCSKSGRTRPTFRSSQRGAFHKFLCRGLGLDSWEKRANKHMSRRKCEKGTLTSFVEWNNSLFAD